LKLATGISIIEGLFVSSKMSHRTLRAIIKKVKDY